MNRASLPRIFASAVFAGQLMLLPWKQTRVSNFVDAGDITSTTVYRPFFAPPHSALQPELDLVRLGYQLVITLLLVWVLTRRGSRRAI